MGFARKVTLAGLILANQLVTIALCGEAALAPMLCEIAVVLLGAFTAHMAELYWRHSYTDKVMERRRVAEAERRREEEKQQVKRRGGRRGSPPPRMASLCGGRGEPLCGEPLLRQGVVAIDLIEVLTAAAGDVQSVPLRTIKAARVLVVDNEWVQAQSAADQQGAIQQARIVYNHAQEWRRRCTDEDTLRRNSHLRVLSLVVLKDWGLSTVDSEIAIMSKHWGRTALQFVLCAELCVEEEEADIEQAELCFRQASALLQRASAPGQVEVLEASCMLKGWQAQLDWLRGDVQSVIQRLEDAHAALEQHGGSALLPTARRYLSEHCAYALASSGFQKCTGIDSEGGGGGHAIDRRSLMRMFDLAIALLGDDLGDAQALRDRALRLKAWLALLEEDFDLTAQALDQHSCYELRSSGHAGSEADSEAERDVGGGEAGYHLLTFTLLFKTNRKAKACSQVLDWVSTTPFHMSRDALQLLQENNCPVAAVEACSRLLDRFAASQEEYSELVEVKHRLLEGEEAAPYGSDANSPATETTQDSAAAARYLETVIDAHSNGQRKLTSATLQELGRRLFRAGCRSFAAGDLHHGIEHFEGAARFLELAEDNSDQLRVQARLRATLCNALCNAPHSAPHSAPRTALCNVSLTVQSSSPRADVARLLLHDPRSAGQGQGACRGCAARRGARAAERGRCCLAHE